jgi:chorismate synthase
VGNGAGFAAAATPGGGDADQMRMEGDTPRFLSHNGGGVLGGYGSGQPIVARFGVKPTSSIMIPRQTVTTEGEEAEVVTKGRHDPCVGIRAVPVGEAMMAVVLADHLLRHRAQTGVVPRGT